MDIDNSTVPRSPRKTASLITDEELDRLYSDRDALLRLLQHLALLCGMQAAATRPLNPAPGEFHRGR